MQQIGCLVKFIAVSEFNTRNAKAQIKALELMKDTSSIPFFSVALSNYLECAYTHKSEVELWMSAKEDLERNLKIPILRFANLCKQREFFCSYAFADCSNQPVWKCVNVVRILVNESFERYKDVYKNLAGVIDNLSDNL